MRADSSLQALRDASPRNQPGFEDAITCYETLRHRITTTPVPTSARSSRVTARRRLISLSTAAASLALVAAIIGLSVSATSPTSAFAAAKKALAATAAAVSGTMTMTATAPGDTSVTIETTRWDGIDIAFSTGAGHVLGPDRQILLIGGGAYVQQMDGQWVHYLNQNEVGYKLGPEVQLAHDNVAGNTAERILELATGLTKTDQPDGSIVYTGMIPSSTADTANDPADDAMLRLLTHLRTGRDPGAPNGSNHRSSHADLQLRLTVAADGLVRQISLTVQPLAPGAAADTGFATWTVTYSGLGSSPPVTAPPVSTPATPVVVTPSAAPTGPHGG
jgi:hypothetical protein